MSLSQETFFFYGTSWSETTRLDESMSLNETVESYTPLLQFVSLYFLLAEWDFSENVWWDDEFFEFNTMLT